MANNFGAKPIVLDTDFASFSAVAPAGLVPVRVRKLALVVGSGSSSVSGVVLVQDSASNNLLAPMLVTVQNANFILFTDDFDSRTISWPKDFKVTGLTATGTQLYLWLE